MIQLTNAEPTRDACPSCGPEFTPPLDGESNAACDALKITLHDRYFKPHETIIASLDLDPAVAPLLAFQATFTKQVQDRLKSDKPGDEVRDQFQDYLSKFKYYESTNNNSRLKHKSKSALDDMIKSKDKFFALVQRKLLTDFTFPNEICAKPPEVTLGPIEGLIIRCEPVNPALTHGPISFAAHFIVSPETEDFSFQVLARTGTIKSSVPDGKGNSISGFNVEFKDRLFGSRMSIRKRNNSVEAYRAMLEYSACFSLEHELSSKEIKALSECKLLCAKAAWDRYVKAK